MTKQAYVVIEASYNDAISIDSVRLSYDLGDAVNVAKEIAITIYKDGLSEEPFEEELDLVKKCIDEDKLYRFGEREPGVFIKEVELEKLDKI